MEKWTNILLSWPPEFACLAHITKVIWICICIWVCICICVCICNWWWCVDQDFVILTSRFCLSRPRPFIKNKDSICIKWLQILSDLIKWYQKCNLLLAMIGCCQCQIRHDICQIVYATAVWGQEFYAENTYISTLANLRQKRVNALKWTNLQKRAQMQQIDIYSTHFLRRIANKFTQSVKI